MASQQTSSITEMFGQSVEVITKPGVKTFEQYERRGTVTQAAIYVAIGAVLSGLFGLTGGIGGFISGVLAALIGFFLFTSLVYYVGTTQGGSGTYNEVAYTFSLFWVPMTIIGALGALVLAITIIGIIFIPIWLLIVLFINAYFAYLAVQSSMNMHDSGKIFITLGAAIIGTFLGQLLIGSLLGGISG
jgi:predicted cobalt transporter CbtA